MTSATYTHGDVQTNLPAPCPYCGASGQKKSRWVSFQSERSGMRSQKQQRHFYQCEMCGARGGESEFEDQALANWNSRPGMLWVPLPQWTASFLLPKGQKYTHLMVHEGGEVTLVEYNDLTTEVLSQVDVDLGKYRFAIQRPPMQLRIVSREEDRTQEAQEQAQAE